MTFTIARTVQEALDAMAAGARPVAGGTDLVVGARHGKAPLPEDLVAIDRLAELANLQRGTHGLFVGATVSHARLMNEPLVTDDYTALADAAALVGSPATRNVGTLGGNIMNGSPAMDTGAPLMVFDATVQFRAASGRTAVPIADLWKGPGRTSARPEDLCVGVVLPDPPRHSGSAYVRLEYRRAMEIAVVGAASMVVLAGDGTVASARCALAAVAPTIRLVEGVDDVVAGKEPAAAAAALAELAAEQSAPISDLRASDRYRRHCIGVMAKRSLLAAARRAGGDTVAVPINRAEGIGAAQ